METRLSLEPQNGAKHLESFVQIRAKPAQTGNPPNHVGTVPEEDRQNYLNNHRGFQPINTLINTVLIMESEGIGNFPASMSLYQVKAVGQE